MLRSGKWTRPISARLGWRLSSTVTQASPRPLSHRAFLQTAPLCQGAPRRLSTLRQPSALELHGVRKNSGGAAQQLGLSDESIQELFSAADVDKSGVIDSKECKKLVAAIFRRLDPNATTSMTPDDEKVIAALVDANVDGSITLSELKASLREWLPATGNRRALVIVDLQNDFLVGSMPVAGGEDAVAATNTLRKLVKFDLVAHTRDWHPADHCSFAGNWGAEVFSVKQIPDVCDAAATIEQVMWPAHCVQNEWGAAFHDKLEVEESDFIVDKGTNKFVDSYSGFFDNSKASETGLHKHLKAQGISEVYVVGVAFDYCVGSTAIDAAECGFQSYIVEDCAKAVSPESKAVMEAKLKEHGVQQLTSAALASRKERSAEEQDKRRVVTALEAARRLVKRRNESKPSCDTHHVPKN